MKVRHGDADEEGEQKIVLQLFKDVMSNDDARSTLISYLTLGDAMALKEASLSVMGWRTKRHETRSVNEKNSTDRLWMTSMVNFDRAKLKGNREKLAYAKCCWDIVPESLRSSKFLT